MATKRFIDLDASFEPHPTTGDLTIRTDERAIKFAVKSLVLTNHFERKFHSEIGSPVSQLMFENIGPGFNIVLRRAISDVITNHEPRVDLIDVIIDDSPDNNRVYVTIIFKIKNTERPFDVTITLNRTR